MGFFFFVSLALNQGCFHFFPSPFASFLLVFLLFLLIYDFWGKIFIEMELSGRNLINNLRKFFLYSFINRKPISGISLSMLYTEPGDSMQRA